MFLNSPVSDPESELVLPKITVGIPPESAFYLGIRVGVSRSPGFGSESQFEFVIVHDNFHLESWS